MHYATVPTIASSTPVVPSHRIPKPRRAPPRHDGTDIRTFAVQGRLMATGYLRLGRADGVYGQDTAAAVRAFQGDHGCRVDGVVGAETLEALWASPAAVDYDALEEAPPTEVTPSGEFPLSPLEEAAPTEIAEIPHHRERWYFAL